LVDLLDEAVERAATLIKSRTPEADNLDEMAHKIGIGAVKYADLAKARTTDYVFDWDTMLSFEGNTAPYLQYAFTRIQSIFNKAGEFDEQASIDINDEAEKALAVKLLQYQDALEIVAVEATPHVLCTYLYELASLYMKFYEACPILKDGVAEDVRASRLQLSALTQKTLGHGLGCLGIQTLDKM
jgi:arginyl-tRNA synthetase